VNTKLLTPGWHKNVKKKTAAVHSACKKCSRAGIVQCTAARASWCGAQRASVRDVECGQGRVGVQWGLSGVQSERLDAQLVGGRCAHGRVR
jgi:hypothetical protein